MSDAYALELDKYSMEDTMGRERLEMRSQYTSPKSYKASNRTEMLAKPKNQYHGKDFFQRAEFRGLFLADHQEVLGPKAFECVDDLNKKTVAKFNDVGVFRDSITARKTQESFYKENTRVKNFIKTSFKTSCQDTSVMTPNLQIDHQIMPMDDVNSAK